jgi:ATP-dependent helicase IRC3
MTALHVARPEAVTLRPYQAEDRALVAKAFLEQGITRALGVWPTAGGKTVMFSELHLEPTMESWLNKFPTSGQKIMVIAHRDELLEQAKKKLAAANPDLVIEIEKADKRASLRADVIVASTQTLSASKGKRLKRFDPSQFRIVVLDEAHHAVSPSNIAILQHFGFLPPPHFMEETRPPKSAGRNALLDWQRNKLAAWDRIHTPNSLLLGVTATPKRGDNIGLEAVFQHIVFNRTIRELMEAGYLCRLKAYRVKSNTSLDTVGMRAGDFATEALASAVNDTNRNSIAVKAYKDYALGLKGVTFCVNVAHAQALAIAYNEAGIPAAAIHGMLSDERRAELIQKFRDGELLMLTNCQILTEGTDIPDIEVIIHARPTKSSLLYIQMTGRGLRLSPGKTHCIIIDIVDVTRKHSLISAPELLGLPVLFDAKGEDLLDTKVKIEEAAKANPLADLEDVKSLDDIQLRVEEVDLLGRFHDEVIDNHAALAWQKTGEGYELNWRGDLLNESLEVVNRGGEWVAQYKKDARGERTAWQTKAQTANEAIAKAEAFIREDPKIKWVYPTMRKDASWRQKPASDFQKDSLQKMGYKINVNNLTAGEAKNLISLFYTQAQRKEAR